MNWSTLLTLAVVGLTVLLLVLSGYWWRRRRRPRTPALPAMPLADLDEIASLWIRGLGETGLGKTHGLLSRPQTESVRKVLYRWLARWSGLVRDAAMLERALEQRPWQEEATPEEGLWASWLAYLKEGEASPGVIESLYRLYRDHGHTIGVPAVSVLLHWLMEAHRFLDAWDIWSSLPAGLQVRLQRRLDPVNDIIRRAAPQALQARDWNTLKRMAAWLKGQRAGIPLRYWILFEVAVGQGQGKADAYLREGIRETDHYWLYRTLESYFLEQGNPPAMQQVYVERMHEVGHTLRSRVLMLLHYLRVEQLGAARELLDQLQSDLAFWPPYWTWLGYVAARQAEVELTASAWATFWALVRQQPEHVYPFQCEVCSFGTPRWWDACPACQRMGTLNLVVPHGVGETADKPFLGAGVEMLEHVFE